MEITCKWFGFHTIFLTGFALIWDLFPVFWYQKAFEHYQQWIINEPYNAQLYYSLGTVYSRSDRVEEGIEQYKKAIGLDPDYRNALFNLASSYDALGEAGWAVTYYERMLATGGEADEMSREAEQH